LSIYGLRIIKNIKKQGFNFSPRFYCKYNGKTLTINENKDYIDIFPENINIHSYCWKKWEWEEFFIRGYY